MNCCVDRIEMEQAVVFAKEDGTFPGKWRDHDDVAIPSQPFGGRHKKILSGV